MAATVFAPLAGIVWKLLEEKGVDPDPLFKELYIDPEWIKNPDKRIPFKAFDKLRAKRTKRGVVLWG